MTLRIVLTLLLVAGLTQTAIARDPSSVDLRALPEGVTNDQVEAVGEARFSAASRKLIWSGDEWMPEAARNQLLALSDDTTWQAAVRKLYEREKALGDGTGGPWLPGSGQQDLMIRAEEYPVRNLLLAVAKDYKLNFVIPAQLVGEVSAMVDGVPVRTAIQQIVRSLGYTFVEVPNPANPSYPLIRFVPIDDQDEAKPGASDPLETRLFPIPDGVDMDALLDGFTALASDHGRIAPNRQARIILVADRAGDVALMEQYLRAVLDALEDDDDE